MNPRVAFFPDSLHEVNGVALTSSAFVNFARSRDYPFLCVYAGPRTEHIQSGNQESLVLANSRAALGLEHDLSFDLLFLRHRKETRRVLAAFRPDLVHITGPNHIGMLGAIVAHDLKVPLVASWHTNIHEFAARRLLKTLGSWPRSWRTRVAQNVERWVLYLSLRFYQLARLTFAPNPELTSLLESRTGRPSYPMPRGIDTELFSPARRRRSDGDFIIGYVGRLSAEKNVRILVEIDRILRDHGLRHYRFLIVGEGGERAWLRERLANADLPGVLRGEALAAAYASMDIFLFPSETDTFGNVVLEALASGAPVVVSPRGGPKFLVREGEDGFIASEADGYARAAIALYCDRDRRGRMSAAARQSALGRSWDAVFEGVYERYRQAFSMGLLSRTSVQGIPGPASYRRLPNVRGA
jgi:phosphatidylinositol alpha 1,6-mannosyltransferase